MPELWDLYDRDRIPIGQVWERSMELPLGTYHLVVYILTFNEKGELLITLRDYAKDRYAGLWEVTGGSALAGEASREAACRELFEETGVKAAEDELWTSTAWTAISVWTTLNCSRARQWMPGGQRLMSSLVWVRRILSCRLWQDVSYCYGIVCKKEGMNEQRDDQ